MLLGNLVPRVWCVTVLARAPFGGFLCMEMNVCTHLLPSPKHLSVCRVAMATEETLQILLRSWKSYDPLHTFAWAETSEESRACTYHSPK